MRINGTGKKIETRVMVSHEFNFKDKPHVHHIIEIVVLFHICIIYIKIGIYT